MARKTAAKLATKTVPHRIEIPKVKLPKASEALIKRLQRYGKDVEEGQEESTFVRYIEATIRHEAAWAYWNSLGDKPKDIDHFNAVRDEVHRLGNQVFGAFDAWQRVRNTTITVPIGDIQQIIYDALMANVEAMPDNYQELDGLARGREFKRVAGDLIDAFKSYRTRITEVETDVPYCEDCDNEA